MLKKITCLFVVAAMTLSATACSPKPAAPVSAEPSQNAVVAETTPAPAPAEKPAENTEKIITVMHNVPDANSPLNKYYQEVGARVEAENPGAKVKFEIYDNETYKKKLQIYASTKTMPDVFFVWSNPSEFYPYVNAGVSAELNPSDFKDYDFTPGALENATVNGKLVGVPVAIDYWYLYYNNKIFTDNGVAVPKTMSELKTAIQTFNSKSIVPIAMNGKDLWNQSVFFNDMLLRFTKGDPKPIWEATAQRTKFAETPAFTEAANAYKELVDMGMFQKSWANDDFATAKNLFLQGKSAMFYVGTWENSMCTSEDTPKEVRDNMKVIPLPSVDGSDSSHALMGREGTTMMVAENSKHKDIATAFLKAYFDPAVYPKTAIEKSICVPMQKFGDYIAADSPELIKEVAKSIGEAKVVASHPYTFRLSAVFEQESKDLNMEFLLGQISAEEFWQKTDESAAANQVE